MIFDNIINNYLLKKIKIQSININDIVDLLVQEEYKLLDYI